MGAEDILITGSRGRKLAIIKRAGAEDILTKDPQKEYNSDSKESGLRGYTVQGLTDG